MRRKPDREWKYEIMAFWVYIFVVDIAITSVLLFGFGGVLNSENFTSWLFYNVMLLGGRGLWTKKKVFRHDPDMKDSALVDVFDFVKFHDPQDSPLGKLLPFMARNRTFFLFWTVVAIILGIGVSATGTFVSGTPDFVVKGQISEVVSLGLSVEPAVFSETVFFNGLLTYLQAGLIYLGVLKFAGKGNVNKRWLIVLAFLIAVPLSAFEFLQYHNVQYPNSEASQLGVLLLGLITSGLTVLTGSLYPAWAIHGSGNFFKTLLGLNVDSGIVTVATILFLILFVVVYRWIFKPKFLKGIAYE